MYFDGDKIIVFSPSKHIKMVKILAPFLFSMNLALCTTAQEVPRPDLRNQLKAVRTTSSIKIDGSLNEPAWSIPDSASSFIQVEPVQGNSAKFSTVVKVLYDENSLYIGAICYDSLGKKGIRVTELYRDFSLFKNDVFSFCIDAFKDERNNMTFAANPLGTQYDYLSFDALLTDADWNGLWKVRTSIRDYGWIAEFEIPWKTLRYKGNDTTQT